MERLQGIDSLQHALRVKAQATPIKKHSATTVAPIVTTATALSRRSLGRTEPRSRGHRPRLLAAQCAHHQRTARFYCDMIAADMPEATRLALPADARCPRSRASTRPTSQPPPPKAQIGLSKMLPAPRSVPQPGQLTPTRTVSLHSANPPFSLASRRSSSLNFESLRTRPAGHNRAGIEGTRRLEIRRAVDQRPTPAAG